MSGKDQTSLDLSEFKILGHLPFIARPLVAMGSNIRIED
jgi:hypothetical protein